MCAECCTARKARQKVKGRWRAKWADARASEVQRTCLSCGHTRSLPKKLANEKAPGKLDMMSARLQATGKEMSLISFTRSSARMKVLAMEEKQTRVLERGQCPACGSSRYREQPVTG